MTALPTNRIEDILLGCDGVTPGRIAECLKYDPDSGAMWWRIDIMTGRFKALYAAKAGDPAGGRGQDGYWRLRLDRKPMLAHRIAFVLMTGEWPSRQVDHIDGNRSNNIWTNLRLATNTQNGRNRGKQKNNTSGFKGVTRASHDKNRWTAGITVSGKRLHLGFFDTPEAASVAYQRAVESHHGVFGRTS